MARSRAVADATAILDSISELFIASDREWRVTYVNRRARHDYELGEIEPVSAVAKLAKTMALDVGEVRGELFAHVALDTRKPEDAQRIQQVLQGAVALVALMGDEEHAETRTRLQHLLEALHLSVSNTRVDSRVAFPTMRTMCT